MDQGWDHTENEDKLLLAQSWALGQIKDQHVDVRTVDSNIRGCSDNMGRSGGQELVSLSSEFGKHSSSVMINNYNLLFDLSPAPFVFPVLIYYIHQLDRLYFSISEISKICNSDPKCTCTCKCDSPCTGNTICLCECTKPGSGNGFCICICKKKQENNCKCICICLCKNCDKCCCESGTAHTCNGCLSKIYVSKLGFQAYDIINQLFYIRCSLQSLSNHLINSKTGSIRLININDRLLSMYSLLNVMDYRMVLNRMVESAKKIDQILELNINIYECKCISRLEWKSKNFIYLRSINVQKIIENISSENNNNDLKLEKINRLVQDIEDNHLCLCMVFKYILYPAIIKVVQILEVDLDTLNTISRKFSKYGIHTCFSKNLSLVMIFVIDILDSISNRIRNNYSYAMIVYLTRVEVKCFCMYSNDPDYYRVVSIILFVSSLVENLWTMDPETMIVSIQKLSVLYSQLEIYDFKSIEDSKKVCCNPVYWLLVTKECQTKEANKCCCCWCVPAFNLLIILIYLCHQLKLYKALGGTKSCEELKKWFELEECKCTCAAQPEKGVCCVLQAAFYIYLTNSKGKDCKSLQEALKECCTACRESEDCCCKKMLSKVKEGLCKVLLLGCECSCTPTIGGQDVKVKCVTFKNPWGCTSVAVLVFSKCPQTADKSCCLIELIEKFKEKFGSKLKEMCEGTKCVCEQLKDVCNQLCTEGCGRDCVCTKLKEKLDAICKGEGGACECLCKQITKTIGECIKKCAQGTCKCGTKGDCCRCVCCKVLGASVRLLVRACRANVLRPYKRITIDLINCGKNKQELMKQILKGINKTTLNRIYLINTVIQIF